MENCETDKKLYMIYRILDQFKNFTAVNWELNKRQNWLVNVLNWWCYVILNL